MTETEHVEEDTLEPTEEEDRTEIYRLVGRYEAMTPGAQREEFWNDLEDEQREALEEQGVTGPLSPPTNLEVPSTTLDAAGLRKAKGEFEAGVNALMDGRYDASQAVLDEIAQIRDAVEKVGDTTERSALLQRGNAVIESVKSGPPEFSESQVQKRRQYQDHLTNRQMLEETDVHGIVRVTELSAEEHPEAFIPQRTEPDISDLTLEKFLSWDPLTRLKFINLHPDAYETLRDEASVHLSARY